MTQEEQEEAVSECVHHWMIESPNGPVSMGTCKVCGESSEFKNSIQGSGWDRESPQSKRARQAKANAAANAGATNGSADSANSDQKQTS